MSAIAWALLVAPASARSVDGTSAALSDSVATGVAPFYTDTAYYEKTRLKQMVLDLGVKHLRGSIVRAGGNNPDEFAFMRDIAASGIKWMLIAGRPDHAWSPNGYVQAREALTDPAQLEGTAEALEGPNEYDDRAEDHPYWGPRSLTWKEDLYRFMAETYNAFKADQEFRDLPYYGPSFARPHRRKEYAAMPGAGRHMDAPNAHIYPGGRPPEESVAWELVDVPKDFGDENRKPVISETGYHNAIHGGNWWHFGVSERAQSIYLLRTVLAAYAAKAPRTYVYQFMDLRPEPALKNQEEHFGLVAVEGDPAADKTTWTVREKPAFESLKELIEITKDSGSGPGTLALDYSLSGAPSGLRQLLLSRKDGSVDLVLWNPVSVYNEPIPGDCNDPRIPADVLPADRCNYARAHFSVDQGDAYPADVPVTLNLGERARVSTERPHSERDFTFLGEGKSFSLNVGADPIFVRIEPKYGLVVMSDDPVAYLRLNETSGAPVDSAGRGATTQPWVAGPTYGQAGAVGDGDTAVRVDGDQRATVTLANPVHTSFGASVEMWVKPDPAVPNVVDFLSAPAISGTDRVSMRTDFPHDGSEWGTVRGATPGTQGDMTFRDFDYGQWHHLVLTMGGQISVSRTYLDGELVGELGAAPLSPGGNWFEIRAFTIGGHAASGGFKGTVDELAVYPKALSATQVCAHYRAAGGSC